MASLVTVLLQVFPDSDSETILKISKYTINLWHTKIVPNCLGHPVKQLNRVKTKRVALLVWSTGPKSRPELETVITASRKLFMIWSVRPLVGVSRSVIF